MSSSTKKPRLNPAHKSLDPTSNHFARRLKQLRTSRGWSLDALANASPPAPPAVGINPGTGKLTMGGRGIAGAIPASDCDRDRLILARMDDRSQYQRLLDEANRANASFYPVDPRGLVVFDSSIRAPLPLDVDLAVTRQRETTLRTLADATDGLAIVGSNDPEGPTVLMNREAPILLEAIKHHQQQYPDVFAEEVAKVVMDTCRFRVKPPLIPG